MCSWSPHPNPPTPEDRIIIEYTGDNGSCCVDSDRAVMSVIARLV